MIEKGKHYRDREGGYTEILCTDYAGEVNGRTDYPVIGRRFKTNGGGVTEEKVEYYTSEGKYMSGGAHHDQDLDVEHPVRFV